MIAAMRLACVVLMLTAACQPQYQGGLWQCELSDGDDACPDGFTCAWDGRCYAPGEAPPAPIDARVDAERPDAHVDARQPDAQLLDAGIDAEPPPADLVMAFDRADPTGVRADSSFEFDVALDSTDAIVISGTTLGDIRIGGSTLPTQGLGDGFLAKFSREGAKVFVLGMPASSTGEETRAVAVGPSDSIVVAGFSEAANLDLGTGPIANNGADGQADLFVTSRDNLGRPNWARFLGSTGADWAFSLATTPGSGEVFVGGWISAQMNCAGTLLTGTGGFVTKHSSGGLCQWARMFEPRPYVTALSNGDVVAGGGTANISTPGGTATLARLASTNGTVVWSKSLASTQIHEIAGDADGNVYVVGWFYASVDFGGGVEPGSGGFVASYASDGRFRWVRTFPTARVSALAVAGGTVSVCGSFSGTTTIGTQTLTSAAGSADVLLVHLSTAGAITDARRFGGSQQDTASDIAAGAGYDVIVGYFGGTVDFNGVALTATGAYAYSTDLFLLRLRH